jgi:hypothetical protein
MKRKVTLRDKAKVILLLTVNLVEWLFQQFADTECPKAEATYIK